MGSRTISWLSSRGRPRGSYPAARIWEARAGTTTSETKTITDRSPLAAVLFDLDGTLVDSLEDLAAAMNGTLAARGHPTFTLQEYRLLIGAGAQNLALRALPEGHRDEATVELCLKEFRDLYARIWRQNTRPYEGVRELLEALRARDLPLGILSNKPHRWTELFVEELFPDESFAVVLGQRKGVPPKPDPMGAHEAAAIFGLEPERILYLGDSDIDMHTARAAGMFGVGALWGFRSRQELQESGARALLEHPTGLLAFFR